MPEEDDSPLSNVKQQLEEVEQGQEGSEAEDNQTREQTVEEEHGPPFPFSASKQRPLYPHENRWDDWEDAKFKVETILRDYDIRNVQGREFDDALLKLGIRNPEILAEIVLEARGLEPKDR